MNNHNLFTDSERDKIIKLVEDNFLKVYQNSIVLNGDLSQIFRIRTHIGSHWVMLAMYLNLITNNPSNKKIKQEVINGYNNGLKNNFKVGKENSKSLYQWNSTWDLPFTKRQVNIKLNNKDAKIIQDVNHGNQVIEYTLSSFKLGYSDWSLIDINNLINTLKIKIWPSSKIFNDKVDGSKSDNYQNSGAKYKQSFGWMKLMYYNTNNKLHKRYKNYYNANKEFIDEIFEYSILCKFFKI